jgi:hypothetical protein
MEDPISDIQISEKLLEVFSSGMMMLSYICKQTTLEFHQVNQVMRDKNLDKITPEKKEKLMLFLYGHL